MGYLESHEVVVREQGGQAQCCMAQVLVRRQSPWQQQTTFTHAHCMELWGERVT